jgi:hypothetical protein
MMARIAGMAPNVQNQPVMKTVMAEARILNSFKLSRRKRSLSPCPTRNGEGGGTIEAIISLLRNEQGTCNPKQQRTVFFAPRQAGTYLVDEAARFVIVTTDEASRFVYEKY